ncbi:c-type cytochrome [bacterium]|nr:c-type cytochrome [bacterium]
MKFKYFSLAIIAILGMVACNYESVDKFVDRSPNLPENSFEYVYDDNVPDYVKGETPIDVTNAKATLGRVLFYDRTLSVNNSTACASCHLQNKGFADGEVASEGFINVSTPRNSMAITNMFTHETFFWDGRIDNLKEMVLMPIQNHIEMGISSMEMLVGKVEAKEYYPALFKAAFGDETVDIDRISESLASFVGSIGSYNSKFDKVKRGEASFTSLEAQGEQLYMVNFDCDACHSLSTTKQGQPGDGFANIGLDVVDEDPGRDGMFKIPDLRNIALTAPYMHDGRYKTLEDVADHYSIAIKPNKNLDDKFKQPQYYGTGPSSVRGLNMSPQHKKALIAFLNTLTDVDMVTDPKFSDPFDPN